ncbi:MAG: TlpA disulfide reductase family protein [Cyclobacteriaceae bacterium]
MKQTLCLILLTLTVAAFAQQPTPEQIKQVEDARKEVKRMKGEKFPEFELTTINGKTYNSEDLRGKIVLLNFWFTGCRPCIEELPDINALADEFKSEKIVFLAPTFDNKAKVDKFLNRFSFNYEVVADVKDFVIGNNIRSFPTHFVIDREGYIEKVVIGYSVMTDNMLRKAVNKLLK